MQTAQAMSQAFLEQRLHNISYSPIHKYIQMLIPYLEQRQEVCKRYYQFKNKLTDAEKENYEGVIKFCESKMSEILNFIQNE